MPLVRRPTLALALALAVSAATTGACKRDTPAAAARQNADPRDTALGRYVLDAANAVFAGLQGRPVPAPWTDAIHLAAPLPDVQSAGAGARIVAARMEFDVAYAEEQGGGSGSRLGVVVFADGFVRWTLLQSGYIPLLRRVPRPQVPPALLNAAERVMESARGPCSIPFVQSDDLRAITPSPVQGRVARLVEPERFQARQGAMRGFCYDVRATQPGLPGQTIALEDVSLVVALPNGRSVQVASTMYFENGRVTLGTPDLR